MILGIGCDICDIRRIEKLIESQGEKFLNRVFTLPERKRLEKRMKIANSFAKVFAAKEALVKALGNSTDISWQDIEVMKNNNGRPELMLYGKAQEMAKNIANGNYQLHLSLSDEPPYALAYVIFCKML